MDEPRDSRVQSNVGLIAKAGVGLVPVRVTPGRRLDLPSASPLPYGRPEPQHSRPPGLSISSLLCLKAGVTRVSPQVHAGGGTGLRGAGPAHPRGHGAGDGRGRSALRPRALAEPRELQPREVSTALSRGLVGKVSVRIGGSCQERFSEVPPKSKAAAIREKFLRHNF